MFVYIYAVDIFLKEAWPTVNLRSDKELWSIMTCHHNAFLATPGELCQHHQMKSPTIFPANTLNMMDVDSSRVVASYEHGDIEKLNMTPQSQPAAIHDRRAWPHST